MAWTLGCAVPPPRQTPPALVLVEAGGGSAAGDRAAEARPARREDPGPGKGERGTDQDRDHDRVIDACDRCPDDPEVWNMIDDHDGCPDSSGDSHARIHYPVNQYRPPFLEIPFERDVVRLDAKMQADLDRAAVLWDERIEEVICLGQAAPGEKGAERLSSRRAEALCKALRIPDAIKRSFAGVGTRSFHAPGAVEAPDAPQPRAIVQVLRAGGMVMWHWDGHALTPGDEPLRPPEPLPGCDREGQPKRAQAAGSGEVPANARGIDEMDLALPPDQRSMSAHTAAWSDAAWAAFCISS
jgi:hypothetical protein